MSVRVVTGRDKFGRGGQHVNDGSESSMALVIDDDTGLGVYCHTERSLRANAERAKMWLSVIAEKEKAAPAKERLCYSDMCNYEVGGRWDCEWFPNTRHVVIPVT